MLSATISCLPTRIWYWGAFVNHDHLKPVDLPELCDMRSLPSVQLRTSDLKATSWQLLSIAVHARWSLSCSYGSITVHMSPALHACNNPGASVDLLSWLASMDPKLNQELAKHIALACMSGSWPICKPRASGPVPALRLWSSVRNV